MVKFYALLFFFMACNHQDNKENQSPVEEETYGGEINDRSLSISVPQMVDELKDQDSAYVVVEGKITSTCKMKGCWMNIALPDGEEMRVAFKDYGFFVPKEGVEGKSAIMEGWVKRTEIDESERRHYAQDAGSSQEEINSITGGEEQLTFVADGVIIRN